MISADKKGSIKVWNLDEEKCIRTIEAHDNNILGIKMVEKNVLLSFGEDTRVTLWDLDKTWPLEISKLGDKKTNSSIYLDVIEQARKIALASCNNGMYLINLGKKNRVRQMRIESHEPTCMRTFSEKYVLEDSEMIRNYLITGSNDSNVYLWDLEKSQSESLKFGLNDDFKSSVVYLEYLTESFNGKIYISSVISGHENGSIVIHELRKDLNGIYEHKSSEYLCNVNSASKITYFKVSPKRNHLIIAYDNDTIQKWNLFKKKCELTINNARNATSFELISNKEIAVASEDNLIRIYSLLQEDNGKVVRILKGHTGRINLLVNTGKNQLFSASDDCTIKFWNIEYESCRRTLNGHHHGIDSLEIFRDEDLTKNVL